MIIHKIPLRNSLRNFIYILADEESKEALAIDPLAFDKCLDIAKEHGYKITQVLNTHHHNDHIGGNGKVVAATGAMLLAHKNAKIPHVDLGLSAGDTVNVGKYVLQVLDTPGHTMSHVCLFYAGNKSDSSETGEPALFSGDVLFNAGVGNCTNGGHPEAMHETISDIFAKLPENTRLFPGHDYIENNLKFTLDREPENRWAAEFLQAFSAGLDAESYVTTLKLEKYLNVFTRLNSPEVRERLKEQGIRCNDNKSTFLALRQLRNQW